MKKILFFLCTASAFAQTGLSIKGGLSINNNEMGKHQVYEPSGRASFFVGASYQYKPSNCDFGFQGELQYTNAGSKGSITGADAQINLHTVNLVLTADYYTNQKLAIKVGPYAGYIVDAKLDFAGSSLDYKDDVKPIDFGISLGAEYTIYKSLYIDGKVLIGLLDLNDTEMDGGDYKIKNRLFQIGLGYRFQ